MQADWLLSHLLLGTEYNELPFILVCDLEEALLREYLALAEKSKKVVLLLMEALLISGLGMEISKGSYSASQGEHMIAHTMEMVTKDYSSSLHGEKIAVTMITMANLQEENQCHAASMIEGLTECFGNTEFIEILKQKQIMQQKIKEIIHKNGMIFPA